MIKKIFIIPGSVDCNRGDQALVWTAIDLLESVFGREVQIGLLTEAKDPSNDISSQQTFSRGYPYFRMLLENPSRVLSEKESNVHYTSFALLRLALRAGVDFLQSLSLFIFSPWPLLARCFLSKEKQKTYNHLRQVDMVVIKGGGFIYAYRGLKYAYYLWYVLFHILLAQRLRIPVVILPNSFGPFETRFSRWLTRKMLKNCMLVTTRESRSQNILENLAPNTAHQFPDMAFSLHVEDSLKEWSRTEFQKFGIKTDGSAIGITMRPWRFPDQPNPKAAYENYLTSMVKFIFYLRSQKLQPVLFAHVRGPGQHETDRLALEACQARFETAPPILVDDDYNCIQMKALYSQLGYMIGTRFHSCIFALSQEIPTLAISYQGYKASGIMTDMGLREYHLHINDCSYEGMVEKFEMLRKNREQIKSICKIYMSKVDKKMNELHSLILKNCPAQ